MNILFLKNLINVNIIEKLISYTKSTFSRTLFIPLTILRSNFEKKKKVPVNMEDGISRGAYGIAN